MSIPVPIDPLGTLGGELPYVQPIMTGYNTWSNTPSFGISFSVASTRSSFMTWCAMVGEQTRPVDVTSEADYYRAWRIGGDRKATLTFEKPLRFEQISCANLRPRNTERNAEFYGIKNGEYVYLGTLFMAAATTTEVFTQTLNVTDKTYFDGLEIRHVGEVSGWGYAFGNLKLKAYYKP